MTSRHQIVGCGGFHSIRTKLILLLTLVVTLVYALVTVIDVIRKSAEVDAELREEAKAILGIQADALAIPLWNFDRDEIERQLDLLVAHPDIVSATVIPNVILDFEPISVRVDDGSIASPENMGEPPEQSRTTQPSAAHRVGADDIGSLERGIRLEDESLGHIVVTYSRARTAKIRDEFIVAQFRQFIIITAVIALTIAVAVAGLVRPILEITQVMAMIAKGDLNQTIPATERCDEIGKMAQALKVFKANAEQLQLALDKQRELNGMQRQFVAMVSHEFRTPLAIIDGNAQHIQRRHDKLTPERLIDSQTKVRKAVARLTELMECVLESARLDEGKVAFEPDAFQIVDMLNELGNNYHELNSDREIIVVCLSDCQHAFSPTASCCVRLSRIFCPMPSNTRRR